MSPVPWGFSSPVLWGLAAAALAACAAALPTTLEGELLARAVQGVVTATFAPCALIFVAQRFPPKLRTVATSALTTAFLASAIVLPLTTAPSSTVSGWRGVFLASGIALAGCAALDAAILRSGNPVTSVPLQTAVLALPGRGVASFPGGLQGLRVASLPALLAVMLLVATLHRTAPPRSAVP
ncbi:MFS transporter [Kineococcus sp. GCM10028916]|uniref:MFS transporter n=1 Tax=Kineococcus sp. GCM10028916 TaxID=3273394 RepID=UPI0036265997